MNYWVCCACQEPKENLCPYTQQSEGMCSWLLQKPKHMPFMTRYTLPIIKQNSTTINGSADQTTDRARVTMLSEHGQPQVQTSKASNEFNGIGTQPLENSLEQRSYTSNELKITH